MAVGEVLKSKTLYKMLLYSLKVIPMILALVTLVNIITSYFDIDLPILSYIVTGLLMDLSIWQQKYLDSITIIRCFCIM